MGDIADLYRQLGQYEKAIAYHEASREIDREIGNRRGEANDWGNLGLIYRAQSLFEKAFEHHMHSLKISREIRDRRLEARQIANIGLVYRDRGEWQQAIEHLEQALAIQRSIGDRQGESNQLGNLGTVYQRMGQYVKSADYHEQALEVSRAIGEIDAQRRHLGNLGIIYADDLKDDTRAFVYLLEAIKLTETLRGDLVDDAFRVGYFKERLYLYTKTIQVSLRLGRILEAWQFVEKARSRTFLDMLGSTTLMVPAVISPNELAHARQLISEVRAQQSKLVTLADDALRNETTRRIVALQKEYSTLLDTIEKAAPEYVDLRQGPPLTYPVLLSFFREDWTEQ